MYKRRLGVLKHVRAGVVALVLLVVLTLGCGNADNEVDTAQGNGGVSHTLAGALVGGGVAYTGLATMEELLAYVDVVARVEYKSARQTIEEIRPGGRVPTESGTLFANAIEITFEVLEYLRGSGADEIKVVLYDRDNWQYTRAEVEALNEDILPLRNTQWDDREAIVFLRSNFWVVSALNDPNRYFLGSLRNNGEDGYTVGSQWRKSWLPDAAAQGARGRASGGEQRFLINLSGGGQGASGQRSTQGESMTISELKALVTRIGNELAAGGTEEHARCVQKKYLNKRFEEWYKEYKENELGLDYNRQFEREVTSGAPSGTEVYVDKSVSVLDAEDLPTPTDIDDVIFHTGQDAALFDKEWPYTAATGRPLPQGTYRFYWAGQPEYYALCDALPEIVKTRAEIVVTVTPPPNTLHEAFFDPVTLTSGVGSDSSNGVLKPTSFRRRHLHLHHRPQVGQRLRRPIPLAPYASLAGHKLDFIDLDGSVSLALEVSSATEDTTAGTLSWSVTDQPWHTADTLMLRISPSSLTPSVAPDTPQTPTGQTTGLRTVSLDWADVPGASSYRIRYWRGTAGWLILPGESITLDFDGSSVTISGLPDRGLYSFSIQAVNAVGSSGWSGAATVGQGI